MNLANRMTQDGLTTEAVESVESNPHMSEMPEGSSHWRVYFALGGRHFDTYYSMGPALSGPPDPVDVLSCVLEDVAGYENARSFEEWAGEYGYDTDSRRAEGIYRAIADQADGLRHLLGELFDEYLWNTDHDDA